MQFLSREGRYIFMEFICNYCLWQIKKDKDRVKYMRALYKLWERELPKDIKSMLPVKDFVEPV